MKAACRLLMSGAIVSLLAMTASTRPAFPEPVGSPSVVGTEEASRGLRQGGKSSDQAQGNPLWLIPLGTLSATRDRPIFSPTRRPPATIVAAPVVAASVPAPPPPLEPEAPPFDLVGTIVSKGGSLAVFYNQASKTIVRLHSGESDSGWVLRSVQQRVTTLEKNHRTVTLALPLPAGTEAAPAARSTQPADADVTL